MTKTGPDLDSAEQKRSVRLLKKLLPWAVLILLFAVLFSRVPLEQVIDEFRDLTLSQILGLSILSIVFIVGVSVLDGTAMWYGFSIFGVGVKFREILLVRAAMMLLASIATLIGQAGLAAFVAKKYKVPPGEAAGTVMFLFLVEIYGMIALATVFLPMLLILRYQDMAGEISVLVAAGIIALSWPALIAMILLGRSASGVDIIRRLRLAALLHPFRSITPGRFFKLLMLKTLLAAWQIGMTAAVFRVYGIEVPVLELFAFMPLAILVSSIPITPARLGTTQWSWVLFFGYVVKPPVLVAFSLLLQFLLNVARWLIGAATLPFIYREIVKKPAESEPS